MIPYAELTSSKAINGETNILSVANEDVGGPLEQPVAGANVILTIGSERGLGADPSTWKGVTLTPAQTDLLISLLQAAREV